MNVRRSIENDGENRFVEMLRFRADHFGTFGALQLNKLISNMSSAEENQTSLGIQH